MKYTFSSFILNLFQGQHIPEPQMLWQDRFFIGLFSFHSFCFHCDFFFFLKIINPYVLTQGAWLPTEVDKYVQKNVPETHPMQTAVQQTGNWGSQVHQRHRISFEDVSDKASLIFPYWFSAAKEPWEKQGKWLLVSWRQGCESISEGWILMVTIVAWSCWHDLFQANSHSSVCGQGWQEMSQLWTSSCVTQTQKGRIH